MIDPGTGLAIGSGIAGLIGGAMTNQSNARIARDQMGFQERMRNTSHQAEVQDLIAAGLNPILSANNGAAVPAGAGAVMENYVGKAVSSAAEAKAISLQAQKQEAEIGLLNSQTRKANTESKVLEKEIPKSDLINRGYNLIRPFVDKIENAVRPNAKQPIKLKGTP